MNFSRFKYIVLVCGSRTYDNMGKIREQLDLLPDGTLIVHGAAEGADWLAEVIVGQSKGRLTAYGHTGILSECKPHACLSFGVCDLLVAELVDQLAIPLREFAGKISIRQQVEWRKGGVV